MPKVTIRCENSADNKLESSVRALPNVTGNLPSRYGSNWTSFTYHCIMKFIFADSTAGLNISMTTVLVHSRSICDKVTLIIESYISLLITIGGR